MKVTITFNLPKEEYEYKQMLKARDMSCILFDLANDLRSKVKYADDKVTEDQLRAYEEIQDLFWNTCNDYFYDPFSE